MITGDIDEDDINSIVELLGSMIEPKGKRDFENINFLPMDILRKQIKAKQMKKHTENCSNSYFDSCYTLFMFNFFK